MSLSIKFRISMNLILSDMKLKEDNWNMVSNVVMKYVMEGENYFNNEFSTPEKVEEHITKGDIVGFNTGAGGKYNISSWHYACFGRVIGVVCDGYSYEYVYSTQGNYTETHR